MVAPSTISNRRFPVPLRLKLQVAYARAWEALADTHCAQAVRFARSLAGRLSIEDALQRYFREIPVPVLMQESVRARALISLGDEVADPPARVERWHPLRLDQLVDVVRRRAHFVEETGLACRLAGALADEAVSATHVAMACQVAELLCSELPVEEAVMHYIRSFNLPTVPAQIVFQRTLAQLAGRHPLIADGPRPVEQAESDAGVETGGRVRQRPAPRPSPALGLRAIG